MVVSDLGMPQVDGFEFIRHFRALSPKAATIPVIALTALAQPEDRRRALMAGFQTHVAKPLDPIEFIALIAALTGRAAPFDGRNDFR